MFRKFADGLRAAANNAGSALGVSDSDGVQRLTAMGFSRTEATNALEATNGNVDQAAELLLAQHQQHPTPAAARPTQNHHNHGAAHNEDEDIRRAMAASLETNHNRNEAMNRAAAAAEARNKPKNNKKPTQSQTATMHKAAEVTFDHGGTNPHKISTGAGALAKHHPTVKLAPKLQDKSIEEQILRCADRLKAAPAAVDTLYRACTTIQQHPNEEKYRSIDTTTAGFQRTLAKAPGAMDFLKAVNFYPSPHNANVLRMDLVDPARIYLGISALEKTKETTEYITAKGRMVVTKEVATLRRDASDQETLKRAAFMAKCPSEPAEGQGAWIQVALADHETIRRRFDGDDTLQDVLNWLGSYASEIPKKLTSHNWMLQDINRYPVAPMDCKKHAAYTLQYLGCFPSGRFEIVPSSDEWKNNTAAVVDARGSARGLGAAPRDAL